MNIKEALKNVGGLSEPSKMPTFGISLPADKCNVGSKLSKVENSICSECYAKKGRYIFDNVQDAMLRRLKALNNPNWIESMAFLMNNKTIKKEGKEKGLKYFRWHDSGDLQNVRHLHMIVKVAEKTPKTKHWLPTRETEIVSQAIKRGLKIPKNLTIRLSAMKFDKKAPETMAKKYGLNVSGASKKDTWTCPASKQKGECKECRQCWNKSVFNVIYKAH
ncbi:MAG: hypothetical protein Unbinned202contig1000_32 [Prokaryotic dsDNA virus sp.]|nr:MAG: hypothetical protein Unbinned202contig1000_32 [Prokaryotic dsDNA virus sp.]|tara:strand:- start:9808 stop:10464 length:657 start_codon:yes stop_codon:yes gene_type:complete